MHAVMYAQIGARKAREEIYGDLLKIGRILS